VDIIYNHRATRMFEIIEKSAKFFGADVLDVGCGYGDLLMAAGQTGARSITGVDFDRRSLSMCYTKVLKYAPEELEWVFHYMDISDRNDLGMLGAYDIAFCTSVLPYLDSSDRAMLLSFLATRAHVTFVEMQYFGDGPGPIGIVDDTDMLGMLVKHWVHVEKIGRTYTGRVPAHRSIWKCWSVNEWERKPHPLIAPSI
jgi:SAM-dependent methyltransferase